MQRMARNGTANISSCQNHLHVCAKADHMAEFRETMNGGRKNRAAKGEEKRKEVNSHC